MDRPIIFSAPMVRALLEGRKTQTRRLAWAPDKRFRDIYGMPDQDAVRPTIWQKVKPGDRLWVRETWVHTGTGVWKVSDVPGALDGKIRYRADGKGPGDQWFPSIHMPRWASRLTLVVTDVRRERVQEISANDAGAEGFRLGLRNRGMPSPSDFVSAWNSIHGPEAWGRNDEVVALTFTVHHRNIDNMQEAA